jgi:hypothetical protein
MFNFFSEEKILYNPISNSFLLFFFFYHTRRQEVKVKKYNKYIIDK